MGERTFSTLCSYTAGWLYLQGFQPQFSEQRGKVLFLFPDTENLHEALAQLDSGAKVEATKFIRAVKHVRGLMHDFRRQQGQGNHHDHVRYTFP